LALSVRDTSGAPGRASITNTIRKIHARNADLTVGEIETFGTTYRTSRTNCCTILEIAGQWYTSSCGVIKRSEISGLVARKATRSIAGVAVIGTSDATERRGICISADYAVIIADVV